MAQNTHDAVNQHKVDKNFITTTKDFVLRNFIYIACAKTIVLSLIIRFILFRTQLNSIHEQDALSLLIGHDTLGGRVVAFRYGSFSLGNIETILVAPLVGIFGMSIFIARILPLLLLAITSMVLWRGFVNTPYKNTMRFSMAILWVWPSMFLLNSMQLTGTYEIIILLTSLSFLSAYYAAHSLRHTKYFLVWSFLSGLLLWSATSSLLFTLVILLWILRSQPQLKKQFIYPFLSFLVGATGFIIGSISTKGQTFYRSHEPGVHPISWTTDTKKLFLQFIGIKTPASHNYSWIANTNIFVVSIFYISVITLAAFLVYSILKTTKASRTDFAHLHIQIIVVHILFIVVALVVGIELSLAFLLIPIISVVFTLVNLSQSKIYLSVLLVVAILSGSIPLLASIARQETQSPDLVKMNKTLNEIGVKYVLAPHDIAYPLMANNDDTITITPLNGNDFDQIRSREVRTNLEAIVIRDTDMEQNNIVYCIQGFTRQPFKRYEVNNFYIYLVENNRGQPIEKIVSACENFRQP